MALYVLHVEDGQSIHTEMTVGGFNPDDTRVGVALVMGDTRSPWPPSPSANGYHILVTRGPDVGPLQVTRARPGASEGPAFDPRWTRG